MAIRAMAKGGADDDRKINSNSSAWFWEVDIAETVGFWIKIKDVWPHCVLLEQLRSLWILR
jgi:hypothetical protein